MKRIRHASTPTPETVEFLPLTELKKLYETLLQTKPPARCGPDFLKGNIIWALQAIDANQCPLKLRQSLLKLANKLNTSRSISIKPGTRLIREWHGDTHEVTVSDHGYLWKEKNYTSLTQIAREITGTHQSGPKFFGLSQKRK